VEEGLISQTRQVGQSGLTVGPELYLAFGISSAVQHVVGMGASKSIMAVNRDPKAPIFRIAGLGIVGDATEILLHVVEALRFRGGKS
jgi:electron transfer flavoprotein alpha subunit